MLSERKALPADHELRHTDTFQTLGNVYPVVDMLPLLVIGLNGLLLCLILWYGREAKNMARFVPPGDL